MTRADAEYVLKTIAPLLKTYKNANWFATTPGQVEEMTGIPNRTWSSLKELESHLKRVIAEGK